MKTILTLALTLSVSTAALAENVYSDQYQTITSIEVVKVVTDENGEETEILVSDKPAPKFEDQFEFYPGSEKSDIGTIIMVADKLIALGQKIYKIIEKGRPVVGVKSEPVQVLPTDDKGQAISAFQLQGWKAPKSVKYRISTKNYLGMKPASMEVMLIFSYGGNDNGTGRYITGAQIKPTKVDVKWGYNLEAVFYVQSIVNQGSQANPVAATTLMLDWKISTVLQETRDNMTFFINGLGQVQAH